MIPERMPSRLLTSFSDLGGHVIAMAVFGYGGYWAYKWDVRAAEIIAEKRAEIASRRKGAVDSE